MMVRSIGLATVLALLGAGAAQAAVANWDCAYDALTPAQRIQVGDDLIDGNLELLKVTIAGQTWNTATAACAAKHRWNEADALDASSHVVARLAYDSTTEALRDLELLDAVVAAYASMDPKIKAATLANPEDEDAGEAAAEHMLDQAYVVPEDDEDFFFDQLVAWYNARTILDAEALPKRK